MKVELQIKTKSFKDDNGVVVNYNAYEIVVAGVSIPVKPQKDKKALLEYLCNKN